MKYDNLNCVIRERYADGHLANLGDSCAETSRLVILGDYYKSNGLFHFLSPFTTGYLRHPQLAGVDGWNEADFSNDQLLPFLMALDLRYPVTGSQVRRDCLIDGGVIPGTKTKIQLATGFLLSRSYRLLNIVNIVQGALLLLPFRVADGGKIERAEGQVQDYLNMIATYVYLRRRGVWATLPASRERCMKAVRKYYLEGEDAEPNADWIVRAYENALLGLS